MIGQAFDNVLAGDNVRLSYMSGREQTEGHPRPVRRVAMCDDYRAQTLVALRPIKNSAR
jgi:hypothetical protein